MKPQEFVSKIFVMFPLKGEDKKNQASIISEYEDSVLNIACDFDVAWKALREECKYRPSISEVVKICRKHANDNGIRYVSDEKPEYEKKWDKIYQMRDEYVANYLTYNPIARQAQYEEWTIHLKEYLENIAFIQAQVISKVYGVGYSLRFGCAPDDKSIGDRIKSTIKNAVSLTEIHVFVSENTIEHFRKQAEFDRLRPKKAA